MLRPTYRPKEVRKLEGIGPTEFFRRLKVGEYDSIGTGHARRITEESIIARREKFAQKAEVRL
jgi:hypothetical protein